MNRLFRRWLHSKIQDDEEKELWWWDVFYRYEVGIGIAISAVLCLVVAGIMFPFLYFTYETKSFLKDILLIIAGVGASITIGSAIAGFIVSPLKESDGKNKVRKDNLSQGSLLLATALGLIANFFINWGPLVILLLSSIKFRMSIFIAVLISSIVYYIILGRVKPNAKDYVSWRFNWAIRNFELLFSRHYKWWTSSAHMSVQKYNLKKFQNYKYHATLAIIMIPLLMTPLVSLGLMSKQNLSNKTRQVQAKTDGVSNSANDVENLHIQDSENFFTDQGEDMESIIESTSKSYDGSFDESNSNENDELTFNNDNYIEQKKEPQNIEDNQCYSLGDILEKDNPQFPSEGNNGFSHFNLAVKDYVSKQLGDFEKGSIYVDFKIDKKGKVYDIDTSLIHGQDLRKKVYQIFKNLHFIPAKKDGKPINVQTSISM